MRAKPTRKILPTATEMAEIQRGYTANLRVKCDEMARQMRDLLPPEALERMSGGVDHPVHYYSESDFADALQVPSLDGVLYRITKIVSARREFALRTQSDEEGCGPLIGSILFEMGAL
jgi:hypothetical protein